tara:strand:- start:63 stop:341 length:279 start_codon:yes stop_codon:yes gene_type:complete
VLDRSTDIREGNKKGDGDPLIVLAKHPKGKDAAIKCYESDEYQRLKAIRAQYTDWNFRIKEGMHIKKGTRCTFFYVLLIGRLISTRVKLPTY